eukprot:CAMPEP_0198198564 /NCGR_PEP_ID=MMETSP1445-20131203/2031_1 /TAXON_ID=36898 /ORGANISM="Pyramimonas sp., Strain CCMP2087" /LENGTH=341 /DNA_ID=CAMNT_0043868167 /DNA_START=86 /DNA_END=1107 /DNA_ORIENTATION=+
MAEQATISDQERAEITSAILAEADKQFEDGCRFITSKKMEEAVEALGKALEIRSEHYGDAAPETASTYYKYGCALYYKAVEDTGVFGSNVPEQVGDEDEENAEEENAEEEEAVKDGGDEETPEEEGTDMELAWEMLEYARVIYSSLPDKTTELAQVHERLADISMEQELFENAADDYQKALELLADSNVPQTRGMIGVLFQLSLALQMQNCYEAAEEKCKEAVRLCKGEIDIRRRNDDGEGAKDLEGVLEDLNGKLEELVELSAEEQKTKATMQEAMNEIMAPLKSAMKGPAAPPPSSSAFDAPQLASSSTATTTINLGVVRGGRVRVTPIPMNTPSSSGA